MVIPVGTMASTVYPPLQGTQGVIGTLMLGGGSEDFLYNFDTFLPSQTIVDATGNDNNGGIDKGYSGYTGGSGVSGSYLDLWPTGVPGTGAKLTSAPGTYLVGTTFVSGVWKARYDDLNGSNEYSMLFGSLTSETHVRITGDNQTNPNNEDTFIGKVGDSFYYTSADVVDASQELPFTITVVNTGTTQVIYVNSEVAGPEAYTEKVFGGTSNGVIGDTTYTNGLDAYIYHWGYTSNVATSTQHDELSAAFQTEIPA